MCTQKDRMGGPLELVVHYAFMTFCIVNIIDSICIQVAQCNLQCGLYCITCIDSQYNRLKCPLASLIGLQCYNMGHNGHGINMYNVLMILMGN